MFIRSIVTIQKVTIVRPPFLSGKSRKRARELYGGGVKEKKTERGKILTYLECMSWILSSWGLQIDRLGEEVRKDLRPFIDKRKL